MAKLAYTLDDFGEDYIAVVREYLHDGLDDEYYAVRVFYDDRYECYEFAVIRCYDGLTKSPAELIYASTDDYGRATPAMRDGLAWLIDNDY